MQTLTQTQQNLLTAARELPPLVHNDGSVSIVGILVSGHTYRTAVALEAKGLGNIRHQGPSMGWFTANETPAVEERYVVTYKHGTGPETLHRVFDNSKSADRSAKILFRKLTNAKMGQAEFYPTSVEWRLERRVNGAWVEA